MKKTFLKTLVIVSLIGGIAVTSTSCKKKGCTDELATNYDPDAKKDDGSCTLPEEEPLPAAAEPTNPQPQPDSAAAVFIAVSTVTYSEAPFVGIIETAIGVPVAVFIDGANFKDVGTVTCETKGLDKQDNNAYVHIPSSSDATGVQYDGTIEWDVTGGNGFPAHTKSSDGTFPGNVEITTKVNATVSTSSSFTLETTAAISDADSVIFAVYGPEKQYIVTKAGTESSHTFTSAEMGSVGEGTGYVQITAYRIADMETLSGGEKLYYINEKVNTQVVTFE